MPGIATAPKDLEFMLTPIDDFVREQLPIDHATEDATRATEPRVPSVTSELYWELPHDLADRHDLVGLDLEDAKVPGEELKLFGEKEIQLDDHLLRLTHRDISGRDVGRSAVKIVVLDGERHSEPDEDSARWVSFHATSQGVSGHFTQIEGEDTRDEASPSRLLRGEALRPLLEEILELTQEAREA